VLKKENRDNPEVSEGKSFNLRRYFTKKNEENKLLTTSSLKGFKL